VNLVAIPGEIPRPLRRGSGGWRGTRNPHLHGKRLKHACCAYVGDASIFFEYRSSLNFRGSGGVVKELFELRRAFTMAVNPALLEVGSGLLAPISTNASYFIAQP
jgi:hypothetical protein